MILYGIYHFLLTLEDCFAAPERHYYIHGQRDFNTDTSISNEFGLENIFRHGSTSKQIQANRADLTEDAIEEMVDDIPTDKFNRRILLKTDRTSSDVTIEKKETTSHSSDMNILNEAFNPICPLDRNFEEEESILSGVGDGTCSFLSNDGTNNSYLTAELEDGNFSLEFLNTAQPIAHSSPLRKKTDN